MARNFYQGEIDSISEVQLKYINDVIQEHCVGESEVFFEPACKSGDNITVNVKRITVARKNKKLAIVAKIAATSELHRQSTAPEILFKNEHIMYTKVLSKFKQMQAEAGISEEMQFKYAKCYGSFAEAPNEVILLEDLKTLGFKTLDKFETLSNECVKSVLQNIAVLHSLSFVLKHKDPEAYDDFKASLIDIYNVASPVFEDVQTWYDAIEEDVLFIFNEPEYKEFLKHKIIDIPYLTRNLSKENDKQYTVILQGDCWTTNIMFRFENKKVEPIMVDYQISRVSSPVYDIMYMIFNCTNHKTRKQHFYDWIDYYYSELGKSLKMFNMEVDLVYPRNILDNDLKRYAKLMFGISLFAACIQIRNEHDSQKIKEGMKDGNLFFAQVKEVG